MTFIEGPDPENPDDNMGVEQEKIDELIEKIDVALRRIGLYGVNFAAVVPQEDEPLEKYGVHVAVREPNQMLVMAACTVGDLAWKRLEEDAGMQETLLHMEHGIIESSVDEIRKKYENGSAE